jgi:hypothetical protein
MRFKVLSSTGPCSDNTCHISATTTVCVAHESHLTSITLPRLCEGDVTLDIDGLELRWVDVDDSDSGDEMEEEWHSNASVVAFDMDIDQ